MLKPLFFYAGLACFLIGCNSGPTDKQAEKSTTMKEKNATDSGWISLFNGQTTEGWHTYGKESVGSAWKAENGILHLDTSQKENGQVAGGDIVTNDAYEDFQLQLEWKIAGNGNSGLMFYVHEDTSQYEYSWQSGPEMQMLHNEGHRDGKIYKHRAGDLYDLIAATEDAASPVGEWNKVEVISQEGMLNFCLNGVNVVSTTLWNENWRELVANSKFREYPGFGTFKKGKIALQDHGDPVWFRNIRIKRL